MPESFVLGWNHERAKVATEQMLASRRYAFVTADTDLPRAISLSEFLLREMNQGQAGTCWVHAGVCLAETLAGGLGYKPFPICRRLVGWVGKQLEGGGNPTNGGSVTDAILAMTGEKGAGLAHEDLYPYPSGDSGAMSRALAPKPPVSVFDDAKPAHIILPVHIRSDAEAQHMIAHRFPVGIGTWWPYNFDDRKTFMGNIGQGTYGHALTKIGYVMPGVWPGEGGKSGWWQWRNWHGRLYPPLPAEMAALVPGYKSDTPEWTTDFWVPFELDTHLQRMGNYEYVSATDVTGLDRGIVSSFLDAFPV